MVEWLEIIVGVVGAIAVIYALVIGYKAPRDVEPTFDLRFDDSVDDSGAIRAALVAMNPGDRPVQLRSLVIQNPRRGIYFLSDTPSHSRTGTFEASDASDVLAIDLDVQPERASEIDFFVGRDRDASREFVVDIEFSNSRTPSIVRSRTLRARLPSGPSDRRRFVAASGREREIPAP